MYFKAMCGQIILNSQKCCGLSLSHPVSHNLFSWTVKDENLVSKKWDWKSEEEIIKTASKAEKWSSPGVKTNHCEPSIKSKTL